MTLRPPLPGRRLAASLALVVLAAAGCGTVGTPATVDPSAPCGGAEEQRAPGLDPEMEALIPTAIDGAAPSSLDSGRYCSAKALGLLAEAGFEEVRFAGATWPSETSAGIAVVVYRAPGLTLDAMADAFARGADDARSVNQVHTQAVDVAGRTAVRIDAAMRDETQTVYLWPATSPDTINVLIGSGVEQEQLDAALETMGDR